MKFTPTPIADAVVVDLELLEDERGFFARAYDPDEFAAHGLRSVIAQANVSLNHSIGTIRGMHYQVDPGDESKLVRVTRGAVWDVIIDMRPESPTYLEHFGVELSDANRSALYVPPMCAHGFQTLADATEVTYLAGDVYRPGHDRGVRYDDPRFAIEWPLPVSVITAKDRAWPDFAG